MPLFVVSTTARLHQQLVGTVRILVSADDKDGAVALARKLEGAAEILNGPVRVDDLPDKPGVLMVSWE